MLLVTSQQMRAIERRTAEDYGIPTLVLMEHAGRQTAAMAWEMATGDPGGRPVPVQGLPPGPVGPRIVVCCGKGNNGGDGLCAARYLHHWGAQVQVAIWADPAALSSDAAVQWQTVQAAGVTVLTTPDPATLAAWLARADVVVDALLGTGVKGAVRSPLAAVIAAINDSGRPVLAVDLPSGLDADTGLAQTAVQATRTLTLGAPKLGLMLYPGPEWVGRLYIADIGIPAAALTAAGSTTAVVTAAEVGSSLPRLQARAHKGTRGRVLVVGGSQAMPGAVAMAATAALRIGAGLAYAAVPDPAGDAVAGLVPELITWRVPAGPTGELAADALPRLLELAAGVDAVALGPGLGQSEAARQVALRLALECPRPMVVDADGLRAFAGRPADLAAARGPRVITPHPGEMGLLLGTSATEVEADRPASLVQAAGDSGAVVVLKGAHTLISRPEGGYWVNPTGHPVLATAGSGDVLTGAIAGLLAQGVPVAVAAVAGVYLHGLAGDRLARRSGAYGPLARDILDELPAARRQVAAAGTNPEGDMVP